MNQKLGWQLQDWLDYLENLHPVEIDLGLDRVSEVYSRLGKPRPAGKIISVAGTNGKGSVCTHILALATAAGLTSASYTSPHLLSFNERFCIRGEWAKDDTICLAFAQIELARAEISLSYFEFATLAGILLMAEQHLDIAVFEVGLGGRLDAVNILDADCVVVTSIALDHQQWLGNDRECIAQEKAGIFRDLENSTAGKEFLQSIIIGERDVPKTLQLAVNQSNQDALYLGRDFEWHVVAGSANNIAIEFASNRSAQILLCSPLNAPIQNDNLVMSYCALSAVVENLSIDTHKLISEFANMQLRGRLELISDKPAIYVDVAHNPAAAAVLVSWLKANVIQGKTWAVCAMFADKDATGVCKIIDPLVNGWFLAGLGSSRGQSAQALQLEIETKRPVSCFSSVASALQAASELAARDDRILVFGSFLTVEQAIRYWNE